MCQSKATGGRRCYSHALKALTKAYAAAQDAKSRGRYEDRTSAEVELHACLTDVAATPTGRAQFEHIVTGGNKVWFDEPVIGNAFMMIRQLGASAVRAQMFLDEAKLITEQSRMLKDAETLDDKVARFGDKAKKIAKCFAPAALAAHQTIQLVLGGRDVDAITFVSVGAALSLAYFGYRKWKKQTAYRTPREKEMRRQNLIEAVTKAQRRPHVGREEETSTFVPSPTFG
jgi:hypothetical protein